MCVCVCVWLCVACGRVTGMETNCFLHIFFLTVFPAVVCFLYSDTNSLVSSLKLCKIKCLLLWVDICKCPHWFCVRGTLACRKCRKKYFNVQCSKLLLQRDFSVLAWPPKTLTVSIDMMSYLFLSSRLLSILDSWCCLLNDFHSVSYPGSTLPDGTF